AFAQETTPSIWLQPANHTVSVGASTSFAVLADGGNLSYQWQKNGTSISSATESVYRISSVQTTDAGRYRGVGANSAGSITSSTAMLKVVVPQTTPTNVVAQAIGPGAISLTWADPATNFTSFVIWRGASSNETTLRIATVPSTTHAFTNSGLASSTV